MAYKVFDNYAVHETHADSNNINLTANGQERLELPEGDFVQNAELSRDGFDLVLELNGETVTIEGYFSASPTPDLIGANGMRLTPELVESFTHSPSEYADASSQISDSSPIGAIQEISGNATITRLDGTVETAGLGTAVFQGDIVETDENGAVNIMFIDETTFAVSEDARLSIDEYVFDPSTQSGTTNFSVLKGVFVFTSGLIGRDDPDDVMINTPSGSIGIRGTIIAGDVDTGEITVIEGAIVLHDFSGNSITLANQFETARFNSSENEIEHMGDLNANDVAAKFMSVSTVAANLFSSIEDAANDSSNQQTQNTSTQPENSPTSEQQENNTESEDSPANAQGSEDTQNTESSQEDAQDENSADAESEEGASLENNGNAEETPENTELANTSEPKTGEIITSSEIAGSDFSQLNKIVNQIKEQVLNNATSSSQSSGPSNNTEQAQTISSNTDIIPPEIEIDRTARVLDRADDKFFTGSVSSHFSYDFSQEFFDPYNTITGFTFSGLSSPEVITPSIVFDNTTGELSFDLDSVILNNSNFDFTVTANTTLGDFSQDFTFNVLQENLNLTSIFPDLILNINAVYNGGHTGGVMRVNGNHVKVFADNADNHIDVNGPHALVKAAGGDDTIEISPSGQYHVYGETGDDTFIINGGGLSTIYSNSNNAQIDGGTGYDILQIDNNGTLDFRLVNNNFIRNIEMLDFENGQANTITLNYTDIVSMTDSTGRLEIDIDDNDTLNFVNNSGNSISYSHQEDVGGEMFNAYTDGNITILIDSAEGTVTGL